MSAMTDLLRRVPVDRVTREAREVDVVRAVLTVVAAVLYAVGWSVGKVVVVVAAVVVWVVVAVKVGFDDARAGVARNAEKPQPAR